MFLTNAHFEHTTVLEDLQGFQTVQHLMMHIYVEYNPEDDTEPLVENEAYSPVIITMQGQWYVSSVGFQARRSATGGSPPPVSGARRSYRWTARCGAPPCDLGSCGNTAILQGVGEMEAGSEQCKEPDDEKLLRVVWGLIEICRFDGKVGRVCRREWK